MNNLTVTEFKEVRVLTTSQLAEQYDTDSKVISKNFTRNQERYQEGKHYISLQGEELKEFKTSRQFDESLLRVNQLYLWTEKGAFLHAKSLNTDKAWEIYDILVDTYFKAVKPKSTMEILSLEFEAIKEVNTKVDLVNEDLQTFKKDMPLLAIECQRITKAKSKRVIPLLGGKHAAAYKDNKLRSRVYRDMENQIYRQFGVDTYKAIKRNQTDMAISLIESYELPMALSQEVIYTNAQAVIKMEA